MYGVIRQQLKHLNKVEYLSLKELAHIAKNLKNEALYNIRQHFFQTGKFLNYNENYKLLKESKNYKTINSNIGQRIIKSVDNSFQSFFALKNKGADCNIPRYLPKDGYATLIIGQIRINGNKLTIPYSREFNKCHDKIEIIIPQNLTGKKIKEIRIIPKFNARFFEIQYIYETETVQRDLDQNNVLGIDLGIDNLATCVSNLGNSFIIDGKKLKSINQWFNKENSRLQSIKDKQKFGKENTNLQATNWNNRNNRVNDYLNKAVNIVVNYCIDNNIGTLVIGYNPNFQNACNLGHKNNQTFTNIPFGKLINKFQSKCELNQIKIILQEESYTSKSSFWDQDLLPTYDPENLKKYSFSGRRTARGLYKTKSGKLLNADVNGALNILRKSKVVDLSILYYRGDVDTPVRIRIA